MHNCALHGTVLGGGVQVRPHSTSAQLCAFTRTNRPVVRSVASALAAAVVSSTTDEESSIPPSTEHAAPQPVAAAPDAETTAPSRRRRRSVTISSSAGAPTPPPEAAAPPSTKQAKASKQQQKTRTYQAPDLHQLFTQDPEASASRVRRVSRQQPAVLPAGAEQDATKVAAANRRAAAAAKAQAQLEQQIDPQVLAAFRPFAESFQEAAKSAGPAHSKAADLQETHADAGRSRQQQTQQQQQQLPQQPSQQVQPKQRAKNKRDFIELFSPKLQLGVQPPQVNRLDRDIPAAPLPEAAKTATQQLAYLIAARQQRQQQQQQPSAEAEAGAAAAAAAAQQQEPAAGAVQKLLGATAPQQQAAAAGGVTRIYTPAPAKGAAASEAERQPLRLMSLRQQQQLREEARKAALLKLRERSVREYEGTLQAMLAWQPSTLNRFYLPGAPTHFPVVVQRQWDALGHSSSSSSDSSSSSSSKSSSTAAASAAGQQQDSLHQQQQQDGAAAAAVRQLTAGEQQTLSRLSSTLQQQLGSGLPDRALRGERSVLLASLSPEAVRERLGRWVGCCGREYVGQLMVKEPTLLGHEPQVLLATLEAVSGQMQLTPKESVALVLKQPALIGLDSAELQGRLRGLADAVGCDMAAAARLATHSATLVMLHPDYVKERMAALAKLLPEAAAKLPKDVVRHPYVLSKSPRAVARNILQMSDALELSSWATCRLVAGQPSLLNTNYDTLRNRLDRLQQLATPVRRWNRELLAMSPPALARCISASDAAIARLQALSDIGSANSRRLPPINKILTMPAQYWAVLFAEVAAARGRAADNWAATAAAAGGGAAAAAAAGSEEEEEGVGVVAGRRTTRAQAAARAAANTAARGASALARGRSVAPAAATPTASSSQSLEEGDGIMESEAAGLLGGDASWRSSLTTAILGAAADMKAQWLGSKGEEGGEEAGKEAAEAGSSRYRRRR